MEIRETSLSFPTTRGSGPRQASATLVFPREVNKAVASIRGYHFGFVGDDHHVGLLQVELDTVINANVVIATGRLGCRDWSGNWDDEYNGSILVTVLADLAPASSPPLRGDLMITDVEINQATQFFRSSDHLDAGNVMPDNSIPLVGGKATGLRFYVDYSASVGAPITTLTGEVILRNGGATTTLPPLANITPRRETEINRGQVDHTLNFEIPAAWCRGRLEVSCRVFDAANPGLRSMRFQRTLQFMDVNPMRVYGVGINYTGAGLNLPAPNQTDLLTTFDYARQVWPTGDILTSGFTTIQFSQSLAGVASDGCGSGFNALLDDLRDLKGDTDDLVYGLLPTGTPLTGVGGCGGGGAGVGMTGNGVTAAHEAGHAVGRKHAPCDDTTRCDSPRNTDDDYPQYGNYVSDSVGEFGYDAQNNTVFDPAGSRDFMGYSGNPWISPYTYRALMSLGDPVAYSPSALSMYSSAVAGEGKTPEPPETRPEWMRRRAPILFLSLAVCGEKVETRPSFTFESYLRKSGHSSGYEVHLVGRKGKVLACVPLQKACVSCASDCGPVQLLGEVPWCDEAKRLVLRKDHHDVASIDVEDKPLLEARCSRNDDGDILVEWKSDREAGPLWFLVQWQDRDGTWRGVAPRTQNNNQVVSQKYLWATKNQLRLRVLAVHLFNTAQATCEITAHSIEPPTLLLVRELANGGKVRATAIDPVGRSLPTHDLVWYDEAGGEINRGADLTRRPGLKGVATVRQLGKGVIGSEGFALLEKVKGLKSCGSRPGGGASRRVLKDTRLHPFAKDGH